MPIRLLIMLHSADEEKEQSMRGMPSLLGRDVLNRWRISYDAAANALTFADFRA